MCGISGFIHPTIAREKGVRIVQKMLKITKHRGPDNSSTWHDGIAYFGHNRLSIIDLTSSANQPMHYEHLTLTFNGEIYNYIELREELINLGYNFKTSSDTEVVLIAFHAWGNKSVNKFMGMWAFSIWNSQSQELFCSRDRFGIKPFYYYIDKTNFYFASEIKGLKQTPSFPRQLNTEQIGIFLQLGWYFNHDQTMYQNVKTLPASHNITFKNGLIEVEKYWSLSDFNIDTSSSMDKADKFRSLFYDSVRLHTRSDVEVGTCLSGGLDSSAIASVYANLFEHKTLKAFNIYYEGDHAVDERPWVNKVTKKYPSIIANSYSPNEQEIEDHFENFANHMEFPSNGSSPMSQYFVMQQVKEQGIKVVINGQGADEYLAGYKHGWYRYMADLLRHCSPMAFARELNQQHITQKHNAAQSFDMMAKSMISTTLTEEELYRLEYSKYFPFVSQKNSKKAITIDKTNGSRLSQFLHHQTFQSSLPNLLHNEDSNSMAFSIESRVPFLDHRLVEYCFALQNDDKMKSGITKRILRQGLIKELPTQIAQRTDKKGFVTPGEVLWLNGPLKFLLNLNYENLSFLNTKVIKSIFKDYKNGNLKNANFVWRIAVLNHWLDKQ